MKWLYIVVGMLIIFYVGQAIERMIGSYGHDGEVQIIKSGAQP